MKKTFVWIIGIAVVVAISIFYHGTREIEDTVVDDVDLEGITEIEANASNKDKSGEDSKVTNCEDTNHAKISETNSDLDLKNEDNSNLSGDSNENNGNTTNSEKEKDTKIETMAGAYSSLSNKTNAWGFVRKPEGLRPEFHGPYTKVLDDYEGIYAGNKENKVVYLTFDEGYENGYTAPILNSLKEKGVTAVFFVTMPYVKQNPELIQRMIDENHIIGNHTVNHPSMPEVTDDKKLINEIMELHNYMVDNYNYEMTYLRPPKGEYSERTVKLAFDLGYKTVLWSSAYDDWNVNNQKGTDYAKKMIYNNLHNGSVILLHAVSKDNANVLAEAIDEIRSRGYEFKSLDEFER